MLSACEKLIDEIIEDDIFYIPTTSDKRPAKCQCVGDIKAIFFNERVFERECARFVTLLHEKKHCDWNAFYTIDTPQILRDWIERKIWNEVVLEILPLKRLNKAINTCMTDEGASLYDLSERLDLPEDFVQKAIEYYHLA